MKVLIFIIFFILASACSDEKKAGAGSKYPSHMTKEQQSFLEALEREREQRNRVVVINQTRVMIADDSSNDQKEHKKIALNPNYGKIIVTVKEGQKISFTMQGNPSTGYEWIILGEHKDLFKSLSVNYKSEHKAQQFGVSGIYTFEFTMKKVGVSLVNFVYSRTPNKVPFKKHLLVVNVTK